MGRENYSQRLPDCRGLEHNCLSHVVPQKATRLGSGLIHVIGHDRSDCEADTLSETNLTRNLILLEVSADTETKAYGIESRSCMALTGCIGQPTPSV